MKRTLIVAHPGLDIWSKNTKAIVEGIQAKMPELNVRILDSEGNFDVAEEQAHLLAHDEIHFIYPTWWYTSPWNLKKYMDTIMAPGFAFGYQGDINDFKLKGKKFGYMTVIGSPEEVYGEGRPNLYDNETFNRWIDSTFHFVSSAWVNGESPAANKSDYMYDPILVHGTLMTEEPEALIEKAISDFVAQF